MLARVAPIVIASASLALPFPAWATADFARTYIQARVHAMNGDHSSAAELLSTLRASGADQEELRVRTLNEALGAGRYDIALAAARAIKTSDLGADARLLLAADEIKRGRTSAALTYLRVKGETGDLTFLEPIVTGWDAARRGDKAKAVATLTAIPRNGLLAPFIDEQVAFVLLKFGQPAEAESYARRAIATAGSREVRMRLLLADAFLAANDPARAAVMVDGISGDGARPAATILAGRQLGIRIDTGEEALSEVVATLSADVARRQRGLPPIGLIQAARFLDPTNSSATALLAIFLQGRNRSDEALALLGAVGSDDPIASPIRDLQVQILGDNNRLPEALKIATAAAADPQARAADFARLGSVQTQMKQHDAAAASFQKAIDKAKADNDRGDLWTLELLRAEALNGAGKWPETKAALQAALALRPDEPLILNYLGYAMLENKEDLDVAEALIRKASELAPDNASIIDSLGWTEFKRGKVDDAIVTLQKAAAQDPDQAEIQEHLGDALFTSGRRYEARFAWRAALLTAEDDVSARIAAKIEHGLTDANAAP